MEDNGLHPVVDLLISRMKSHPEEFYIGLEPESPYAIKTVPLSSRWTTILNHVERFANEEELAALKDAMRHIRLDEAHEKALDELLNGPERRAEEEKERERTRVMMQQAAMQKQQSYLQQASGVLGLGNQIPTTPLNVTRTPSLQIGNETLDAGMIDQIKRKLGL